MIGFTLGVPAPIDHGLVEVTVPVHDEEHALEQSVRLLTGYLDRHFPFRWQVTVADNASTDETVAIAERLAGELEHVQVLQLAQKGAAAHSTLDVLYESSSTVVKRRTVPPAFERSWIIVSPGGMSWKTTSSCVLRRTRRRDRPGFAPARSRPTRIGRSSSCGGSERAAARPARA